MTGFSRCSKSDLVEMTLGLRLAGGGTKIVLDCLLCDAFGYCRARRRGRLPLRCLVADNSWVFWVGWP